MIVSNCKNPSKIQLSPAAGVMVVMAKDEGDIGLRPLIHGPCCHWSLPIIIAFPFRRSSPDLMTSDWSQWSLPMIISTLWRRSSPLFAPSQQLPPFILLCVLYPVLALASRIANSLLQEMHFWWKWWRTSLKSNPFDAAWIDSNSKLDLPLFSFS